MIESSEPVKNDHEIGAYTGMIGSLLLLSCSLAFRLDRRLLEKHPGPGRVGRRDGYGLFGAHGRGDLVAGPYGGSGSGAARPHGSSNFLRRRGQLGMASTPR